ncbi:hypothetical protein BASA62_001105 [Batrachochytrium salamandrivorans]|nr:hypothetical protein BASA62_001105 [Batrachochytrium salamandrivorans]
METLRTSGDSASLQKYVTRQLLDTSGFFKDPSFDQSRAHGTRYLMLARMDALWTARKAIQIGILVDTHPFSVDHCILCDQQLLSTSIAHLVVECEQVTGHRIQSGLVPAIQKSRLRLLGRALDPGVENVYTWLRGGVINGEADLDQRWLDGTVEHESMGTRHDNRALAARLADFLQVAYRQYQSTLWKYHRDRLGHSKKKEFRKREECVGQVVSLVDIIQRRQNAGLNTHVLFIDIRKDIRYSPRWCTVMEAAEHGISSSYSRISQGTVHIHHLLELGHGQDHFYRTHSQYREVSDRMSIVWTSVQSVHQTTFSMVSHPSQSLDYRETRTPPEDSCTQTMWQYLPTLSNHCWLASTAIEQWANRPLDIRLHGQLVSRVESYKYLGVLIDSKLDHSAWLKQKRSALEHTISALHPVLANHQLTVNYRSRIFSAVVMGKAYYGFELVGGNKSHLAPLQTTINKGIRLFTGARLSTAIGPLLVETGIGSLLTRSLVSRVRLLERSVTKRTPINAICSGTDNDVFTLNVQGQLSDQKTVKQRHSFALMETLRTCGDSASLQKYVTRQLLDTSGFFKDPSFDQSRAHGTRYLMLARMDALWTARKAIQIGILVDTHPFSADHCILCDQQLLSTSTAHLVVDCEQVAGHCIQSGLVPAIQKSRLRLLG